MNNDYIKKNTVITILSKKEYKYLFLLFASEFLLQSVVAQDIIRLQYNDSISCKVINVSQKEIVYQSQTFYDSGQYSIKRKKIIEIKYADGKTAQVLKLRWDKFYRPAFFFSFGQNQYESGAEQFYLSNTSLGFGNKGFFRLPIKGFGIIYNADLNLVNSEYHDYSLSVNTDYGSYLAYSLNLSAGLEYRYSIFRGLGFYGDFQIGKSYVNFNHPYVKFYSEKFIYSLSTGIYIHRVQLGIKYNRGQLMRQTDPKPGEKMQLITGYDLSEIRFSVAIAF
jgi:hypothetical protein